MHPLHRAGAATRGALIFLLILATTRAVTVTITPGISTTPPAPATPVFTYVITGQTYSDAYGETASDYVSSCHMNRHDGQTWQIGIYYNNIGNATPYQNSFTENSAFGAGVYTYVLYPSGYHPEPYDNFTDAHWEDEHDNPDDDTEVTGRHWVEASRDVGFAWVIGDIGYASVQFIIGNAAPDFVTWPQSRTVALGSSVNFGATATRATGLVQWERLPAGGSSWQNVTFNNDYHYNPTPGGWPAGSSMISFTVTSPGMNGDQYRAVAGNAAGITYSPVATLTTQGVFFDGGGMIEASYATPQTGSAGYLQFNLRFTPGTYVATDGETADDQLDSYAVYPPDSAKQTFVLVWANGGYQGAFGDNRPAGIYAYGVSLHALHPEPYDRWVEAHWENEYDNPDDDTEITGHRWVETQREIGFDWTRTDVAGTTVPFYLDVPAPAPSAPPTFSRQPAEQTVVLTGSSVTAKFSAAVVSEGPADLKWQRRSAGGAWTDIAESGDYTISTANNRPTLTITVRSAGMNGDQYRCVASNAAGSATSNGAGLNVYTPPVFVSQPANRNGGVNAMINVSFTATANGQPAPAYQWQRLGSGGVWIDLASGYPYSGADSSTLTYNGYMGNATLIFRCIASNPAGGAISGVAVLQPVSLPVFTGQPTYQAVDEGHVANFSTSVDGSPSISYQWKRRNLDGTWTILTDGLNYTGTTTGALAVWNTTPAMSGQCFVCVATNSGGSTESYWASLYVWPTFAITTQPQSRTVALGNSTSFSVEAFGTPAPSYWWQRWDGSGWRDYGYDSHYSGWWTNVLTVSNMEESMSGARFRCRITSGARVLDSVEVTLTVDPTANGGGGSGPPVITRQPASQVVQRGTDAVFLGGVTGSSPITFQWFKNGAALAGATNVDFAVLSVGPTDVGSYYFTATNSFGAVTSVTATLSLKAEDLIFPTPPNRSKYAEHFQLAAKSMSGLPVSFILIENPNGVIESLNGLEVTLNYSAVPPPEGARVIIRAQTANESIDRSFRVSNNPDPDFQIGQQGYSPPPQRDIDGDGYVDEVIPAGSAGFEVEVSLVGVGADSLFEWVWSPFWPFNDSDNYFGRTPSYGYYNIFPFPVWADVRYYLYPDDEHVYYIMEEEGAKVRGGNTLAEAMVLQRDFRTGITGADRQAGSPFAHIPGYSTFLDILVGRHYFLIKDGKPLGTVQVSLPGEEAFSLGVGSAFGKIWLANGSIQLPRMASNGSWIAGSAWTPSTGSVTIGVSQQVTTIGGVTISVDILHGNGVTATFPGGASVTISQTGRLGITLPAGVLLPDVLKRVNVLGVVLGGVQVGVGPNGKLRAGIPVTESQTLWFDVDTPDRPSMEIVSRDRFLAGSLTLPDGSDNIEVEFVNRTTNGSMGRYGSLLGDGSTKIYNSITDILSTTDPEPGAAGAMPDEQKVWFIKDGTIARKLQFYTCFEALGSVEIRVYKGGELIQKVQHELTAASDFGDWINYVDRWVTGSAFGSIGASPSSSSSYMASTAASVSAARLANIRAANLIPIFNAGAQVDVFETLLVAAIEGTLAGLRDDWEAAQLVGGLVVQYEGWRYDVVKSAIEELRRNPEQRGRVLNRIIVKLTEELVLKTLAAANYASSTWDSLRSQSWNTWSRIAGAPKEWTLGAAFAPLIANGIVSWLNDFTDRMMVGAEKTACLSESWNVGRLTDNDAFTRRLAGYTCGYTIGYLTEQVAVGVLTLGITTVGEVIVKGGPAVAMAMKPLFAVYTRVALLKNLLKSAVIDVELRVAIETGLNRAAVTPFEAELRKPIIEVIESALSSNGFDRTRFNLQKVVERITQPESKLQKMVRIAGQEHVVFERIAKANAVLGANTSALSLQGWLDLQELLLRFDGTVLIKDLTAELPGLWKATVITQEDRLLLRDALEAVASRKAAKPNSPWVILRYDLGQAITRGQGHAIEAHHLIEQRHLKNWNRAINDVPSVILSWEDHFALTQTLEEELPSIVGVVYTPEQVWPVYQRVYAQYPEWLDAIRSYFVP